MHGIEREWIYPQEGGEKKKEDGWGTKGTPTKTVMTREEPTQRKATNDTNEPKKRGGGKKKHPTKNQCFPGGHKMSYLRGSLIFGVTKPVLQNEQGMVRGVWSGFGERRGKKTRGLVNGKQTTTNKHGNVGERRQEQKG